MSDETKKAPRRHPAAVKQAPNSWEVLAGRYGGFDIAPSAVCNRACHHRNARVARNGGACGGCYARAIWALQMILGGRQGKRIAAEVFEAIRKEVEP